MAIVPFFFSRSACSLAVSSLSTTKTKLFSTQTSQHMCCWLKFRQWYLTIHFSNNRFNTNAQSVLGRNFLPVTGSVSLSRLNGSWYKKYFWTTSICKGHFYHFADLSGFPYSVVCSSVLLLFQLDLRISGMSSNMKTQTLFAALSADESKLHISLRNSSLFQAIMNDKR